MQELNEGPFCVDCKHFIKKQEICSIQLLIGKSLVTGKEIFSDQWPAQSARHSRGHVCGIEGKMFVPKGA